jgi:hypothetical protein
MVQQNPIYANTTPTQLTSNQKDLETLLQQMDL